MVSARLTDISRSAAKMDQQVADVKAAVERFESAMTRALRFESQVRGMETYVAHRSSARSAPINACLQVSSVCLSDDVVPPKPSAASSFSDGDGDSEM